MVLNTYCVIPRDIRFHPFFHSVFKDGVRVCHEGKVYPLTFSSVLAHSPHAVQTISSGLLQAVHAGRESMLVVAPPTAADAETITPTGDTRQLAAAATHDTDVNEFSSYRDDHMAAPDGACSTDRRSGAAVLDLYRHVLHAVQRATRSSGEAHLTMITACSNSRVLLDELGMTRIARVEDAVARRLRYDDADSACVCQHVLRRWTSRHTIDKQLCSRISHTACVATIRILHSKGVMHIVDVGSHESVLCALPRLWSTPHNLASEQTCLPRSSWSRLCQTMSLPATGPERAVHVVAIPNPRESLQGTMRVMQWVAGVRNAYGLRPSDMQHHDDSAQTRGYEKDVGSPSWLSSPHIGTRTSQQRPLNSVTTGPCFGVRAHAVARRRSADCDGDDDGGMDMRRNAEATSPANLPFLAPFRAHAGDTHPGGDSCNAHARDVCGKVKSCACSATTCHDTLPTDVDVLQSAIWAELSVIEQQLLRERATRMLAEQQTASLQGQLREGRTPKCALGQVRTIRGVSPARRHTRRCHPYLQHAPSPYTRLTRKCHDRCMAEAQLSLKTDGSCDHSDCNNVASGVGDWLTEQKHRHNPKQTPDAVLRAQHGSASHPRHARQFDPAAQTHLSCRGAGSSGGSSSSSRYARAALKHYPLDSSSSSYLMCDERGDDDTDYEDGASGSQHADTWPLVKPIGDAHHKTSPTAHCTHRGAHPNGDVRAHGDQSDRTHHQRDASSANCASCSHNRSCTPTPPSTAHSDEMAAMRVQLERARERSNRLEKTVQSFRRLINNLPDTVGDASSDAQLSHALRAYRQLGTANDKDVLLGNDKNNTPPDTDTPRPTPCDVVRAISALQLGCRKLRVQLGSIPPKMHCAFAPNLLKEHICALAALEDVLYDIANRRLVLPPHGIEMVRSIPHSATANEIDTVAAILRFESERSACAATFVPVFAQLAVAVDHILLRVNPSK